MIESYIVSINISKRKGVVKEPVQKAEIKENWGIIGDAHAGNWHRQISMLSEESIDKMRNLGYELKYGDFAENITVKNGDIYKLPVGTKVKIGETLLEITQIGKKCHTSCAISQTIGKCVMPIEGIFLKVLKGGEIKVGDSVIFYTHELTNI
ncbi:MOSC domain-containing protein YiiM [Marinitoga hydrogenitolerans DSM 16785]|uniref:MOSC domain-containing protein YiiM n=1 Tax=Marinitoga hydrogenitolerans (strain DSM 16785 / JCM 12826 / AT1271) TaxID=1122195 RepID=A0A1M5A4H8_MARH1|nr:MOSC domain-containing protein [Marinitoga hydrogenitolerans]SHF24856.1 MOSC domain-containing protein YiiM [Marinitoga hydrogenitolerans DSM 16785]